MYGTPTYISGLHSNHYRTLYNVMYKIIDSCYGQNLGFDNFRTDSELAALILKGEEQLGEWQSSLVPLKMSVHRTPLQSQDLDKMEIENKILERFIIVLSVRYHNLRILLHRPMLENYLDACGGSNQGALASENRGMVQHLGISSIETCVDSAVMIISIVRTVVMSEGWRRDLLGAWNYSLFYSKPKWWAPSRRSILRRRLLCCLSQLTTPSI